MIKPLGLKNGALVVLMMVALFLTAITPTYSADSPVAGSGAAGGGIDVLSRNVFGGASDDSFNAILATSDGGFVAVGRSSEFSFGNGSWDGVTGYGGWDAIAVKYSSTGSVEWAKNFGGEGDDYFSSVAATTDGGFVAVGRSSEFSFGTGSWVGVTRYGISDAIAVKFSSTGSVEWAKNFGGRGNDDFRSVAATSDGGFVAVGASDITSFRSRSWAGVTGYGYYDAVSVKYSSTGSVEWAKNFGGAGNDYFSSVATTSDGGFVAVGYSAMSSFGNGSWAGVTGYRFGGAMAVKYSITGSLEWAKNFGGTGIDYFSNVAATSEGGFVAVGHSSDLPFGNGSSADVTMYGIFDAIAVKFSSTGSVEWAKNFGGASYSNFSSVAVASDGGFVAVGSSDEPSFGNGSWEGVTGYGAEDAIAVKFSSTGSVEWAKNFGGEDWDYFNCVAATSDEGFIVVGHSNERSFGNGSWEGVTGHGGGAAIVVNYSNSGGYDIDDDSSLGNGIPLTIIIIGIVGITVTLGLIVIMAMKRKNK